MVIAVARQRATGDKGDTWGEKEEGETAKEGEIGEDPYVVPRAHANGCPEQRYPPVGTRVFRAASCRVVGSPRC